MTTAYPTLRLTLSGQKTLIMLVRPKTKQTFAAPKLWNNLPLN